jgi:hypothetical protein
VNNAVLTVCVLDSLTDGQEPAGWSMKIGGEAARLRAVFPYQLRPERSCRKESSTAYRSVYNVISY